MKALVLSGGGSKGAFQTGALRKLLDENPELDYDIYTGISVGALNASFLATGPLKETLPGLEDVWLKDIKGNSSVRKHRILKSIGVLASAVILFGGLLSSIAAILQFPVWLFCLFLGLSTIAAGLLVFFPFVKFINYNKSIYNTKPLSNLINKKLDLNKLRMSGKRLCVGAVSYQTGEYKSVDQNDPDIVKWILASSAFPVFFPMQRIKGQDWLDGGVRETAPLKDAIDMGAKEIDIILTQPLDLNQKTDDRIFPQISRAISLMTREIMINDIVHTSDIKIRLIVPVKNFDFDPLAFKPKEIKEMYNAEYKII